jgi:lysylphosphatidylglycerol synthetase-like protein (DUF2156 family)
MKTLDLYLAALISPRRLFEEIVFKRISGVVTPAFFAFLGGVLSATLAFLILFGVQGESGRALFSTLAVFVPLAVLFVLMFKLALVHLFASIWGLRSDVRSFWVSQSLSFVPFFLLLPLTLILRALDLSGLFALALIAAWALSWRIEIIAMSAVYSLSTGRAFMLSLLPLSLAFAFALIVLFAFVTVLGGFVFALMGLVF